MDKQQNKTVYQPPKIVTVAFNVEIGTGGFSNGGTTTLALPMEDGNYSTGSSYNSVANSGSGFFGGGNTSSTTSGTEYDNSFEWGW